MTDLPLEGRAIMPEVPETPSADDPAAPAARKPLWRRFLPLAILALLVVLTFVTGLHRYISFTALSENYGSLRDLVAENAVLAGLGFMALYAVAVGLSLPGGLVLSLTGGLLFGTWLGGGLIVLGATIGAVVVFLIARSGLGQGLLESAGPFLSKLSAGFRENAFSYLLFLRLVPLFPFWLVNLVPAAFDMDLRRYTLATILGIAPASFIFASVGSGIGEVIMRGETPDLSLLSDATVLGPLVGLAILSLVPALYRKLKRRSAEGVHHDP